MQVNTSQCIHNIRATYLVEPTNVWEQGSKRGGEVDGGGAALERTQGKGLRCKRQVNVLDSLIAMCQKQIEECQGCKSSVRSLMEMHSLYSGSAVNINPCALETLATMGPSTKSTRVQLRAEQVGYVFCEHDESSVKKFKEAPAQGI